MSQVVAIRRKRPLLALALVLLPFATGCVKKSTHEATLDELAEARQTEDQLRAEMRDRLERAAADQAAVERRLGERIATLQEEIERLEALHTRARSRFEEAREEVHRLELVLAERGSEARRMQERLRRLSALEREVRQRNEIFEEVIQRFQSLIDGGRLSVSIDRGRLVIHLPQDILFESGSATLAPDGRRTLDEVGSVLAELDDRSFQVEGHTDDVPISTSRFPSNWELSTARALSVVRVLEVAGVAPENLSGAGFGEHQPIADNDDPEGRRRNRRIEIVMLPNLDLIADVEIPR